MLRAAARLVRSDLRARPVQAFLTGLVLACSAAALVVTLHLRAVFDAPWEDLERATAGADVVIAGPAGAVARAGALPDVAAADAPRPLADVPVRLGSTAGRLTLVGLPRAPRLDRPLLTAGRVARTPGEVVLDVALAGRQEIGPGAELTAGAGARARRLRVVGLATVGRFAGGGWVTVPQARALRPPGAAAQVALPVRLRDRDRAEAFAATAERRAGVRDLRFGTWEEWRADFVDSSARMLTIMAATTSFALLATAFTLATAIGGRVIAERRRIALLRAVGMTPAQAAPRRAPARGRSRRAAAPPGLVAGAAIAPRLLEDGVLPGAASLGPPGGGVVLAALAVVLVVVAAATAVPAWRAGRVPPVRALATARGVRAGGPSRTAALARRLRLPAVAALGLKDAFAQRARAGPTLGSLVLAAVLVVCALAFEATMDRLAADPALRAQPWDVKVAAAALPAARIDRLVDRPGVAAMARVSELALTAPDGAVPVQGRVFDRPPGPFRFAVREGRSVERPGEATAGRGLLDALHAHVGDRVTLASRGRPFAVRIVGRHVEPDAGGRAVVLAAATLPASERVLLRRADRVLLLRPGVDAAAFAAALLRDAGGRIGVDRPIESLRREAAQLRPVVYGVTALLIAIALVNLLSTLLLGRLTRAMAISSAVTP